MGFSKAMARGFARAITTCTGAQALAQGVTVGLQRALTGVKAHASALGAG